VEKEELMSAVWPETVVEESNLTRHISVLRKVLGESAGERPYIETIPRRGYRFLAEVERVEREVVTAADFDNKTGDASFDGTLKQGLAIQLQQWPFLTIFPEVRAQQTLGTRRFQRAVSGRPYIASQCVSCRDCALEATRTQARVNYSVDCKEFLFAQASDICLVQFYPEH